MGVGTQLRGLTVPVGDFLIIFVGGRCVSVSFPVCTFGKSDASFMIQPARSGNRSTAVPRHLLAQTVERYLELLFFFVFATFGFSRT